MGNIGGLRRRWLRNTASVVVALGLVCVMAITAAFAAYSLANGVGFFPALHGTLASPGAVLYVPVLAFPLFLELAGKVRR